MIRKLLIANRGEIACRIIRTAHSMGIITVAIYSEADRNSRFVELADEAWCVGEAEPASSYLNQARIIEVAKSSGAQAIHPGYGFLAENASFAAACEQAGILFVGPTARAIEAMGLKSEAKQLMFEAGVPLVPGYHGASQDNETLEKACKDVGFPLLIKASAGGGGKGMRIVTSQEEVSNALASAKREALSAFGNSNLLIERYIAEPRHVEVQIFCDQQGNGVYLHDRDCSVQRRHQKVVEEAPAPNLSDLTRKKMGEAALKCAHAINYSGAGTIEFLVDAQENFFFMEMNTRLQVEHPVTEMITGLDLVEWQLRVASGENLPLTQEQIPQKGHAIEARVCAEDIYNQFLPDTGNIHFIKLPSGLEEKPSAHGENTPCLRLDSGVVEGDNISIFYDPMIAKLIAWHPTRTGASLKLAKALGEYKLGGIKTNISLLKNIVSHPAFLNANISTHFIDHHKSTLIPHCQPDLHLLLSAAAYLANKAITTKKHLDHAITPWDRLPYWRLNLPPKTTINCKYESDEFEFSVSYIDETRLLVEFQSTIYQVLCGSHHEMFRTEINGQSKSYNVFEYNEILSLFDQERQFNFTLPTLHLRADEQDRHSLRAPMNAKVTALLVEPGASISKGDPILVVEAMKMEHTLTSPSDGVLIEFFCKPGDLVTPENELVDLDIGEAAQ
ncbi:MAG: ATP-grasp domain-containing protein [Hahellaceae bacterium]|nr:ATP-grasp domain-containing protein [Hahellaceae bacterium]MCP5170415.1 ATP-grasp domain-containing protein [Hahellaceae bacterium]